MVIKYLICQLKHKTINLAIALVPRWYQSLAGLLLGAGVKYVFLMAMIHGQRAREPNWFIII